MPLKQLDFIMTILERIFDNMVPKNHEVAEKYHLVLQSFQHLIANVFKGYTFDFYDPHNPERKHILRIMDDDNKTYQIYNTNEFEELSDLILYHNGVDVSYRNYPIAMRKELERNLEILKKQNKQTAPSVEKMIDCAFLYLKSYETVLNLPVRKFYNFILNVQKREEYTILMSGAYIVKNISYWMTGDYDRDPYKALIKTEEQTLNKFKDL